MERVASLVVAADQANSAAVMDRAFASALYAQARLLQAIGGYLATPTVEARERVAGSLLSLEDSAEASRAAMQDIRRHLVEDDADDIRPQLHRLRAGYEYGWRALQRHTHQIMQEAQAAHSPDTRELAQALSGEIEDLAKLWQRSYVALMKEEPRHVRHFFSYVCERFDALNSETTRLAIAALNNAKLRRRSEQTAEAQRLLDLENEVLLRMPLPDSPHSRRQSSEPALTRAFGST